MEEGDVGAAMSAKPDPVPRAHRPRRQYNQLLRIEDDLDEAAVYAGRSAFPRFQG